MRFFAYGPKQVGSNDGYRKEKQEMRKYGMKRHFYDKIPLV